MPRSRGHDGCACSPAASSQVAATAAILPNVARALAQQRLTQAELLALRAARQRHAAACHRCARPADAGLFPRAVEQSRRRRREGPAAAHHRQGLSRALRHSGEVGRRLCADRGRFRGAGAKLWPHRRARPPRDRREGGARRARRRRVLLLDGGDTWQGSLGANRTRGPGHGRLLHAAEARRHDRPLGVHLRRRAGEGARPTASAFRFSRSMSATPNGRSRCSTPTSCSRRAA